MKAKKSKQQVLQATTLISQFTDQDINKRLNSSKKLSFIAEILPPQRIKNQLIPFLRQQIIYDQPSIMYQTLLSVETLAQNIGGPNSYLHILPFIEDTLEFEDQKVRKLAVEKYNNAVNRCDIQKCQNQIYASLQRLFSNQYDEVIQSFCSVVAKKLGNFSPTNQQQLISNYISLVQDLSITKRKYACKYSKDLIQWLNVAEVNIMKIIQLLSKDKQQSHRIYFVDVIIQLARFNPSSVLQSYFNLISYQFPWRVRYQLISKIQKLAQIMGKDNFKSFINYYIKYLNDIEPQIRSIANLKLQNIVMYIEPQDIIMRIIPNLKNIPQDSHVYVRNSLASSLLHLCPVIGKKATVQHILPKFLAYLKDEQDQQVKQTIFKKVSIICEILGIQTLSQSIIPILQQMIIHTNWRIRIQAIQILLYIIKNSPITFVNQKIIKWIVQLFKDRADSVRKQTINLIIKIIQHQGNSTWVQKNIFPKILPMFKSNNFVHRQTLILSIESFAPKLSPQINKSMLNSVVSLALDPVQNVKMSVCIALGSLYYVLPKDKQLIKKTFKNLKDDKDIDVKQMASKIISKLQ